MPWNATLGSSKIRPPFTVIRLYNIGQASSSILRLSTWQSLVCLVNSRHGFDCFTKQYSGLSCYLAIHILGYRNISNGTLDPEETELFCRIPSAWLVQALSILLCWIRYGQVWITLCYFLAVLLILRHEESVWNERSEHRISARWTFSMAHSNIKIRHRITAFNDIKHV